MAWERESLDKTLSLSLLFLTCIDTSTPALCLWFQAALRSCGSLPAKPECLRCSVPGQSTQARFSPSMEDGM